MQASQSQRLDIPDSLRQKILAFRRRVWTIKIIEAVAGAVVGILAGYLLTYALDRVFDTPAVVRWMVFAAAVLTCGLVPLTLERWVWRNQRLDQLARLLTEKHPDVGDQLLGIIELAENDAEQTIEHAGTATAKDRREEPRFGVLHEPVPVEKRAQNGEETSCAYQDVRSRH